MLAGLDYLRELNMCSVILRLTLAMLCGGLIGMERGRKHRPAGFRTYMLVCLGAALTMLLGQYEWYMMEREWAGFGIGTQVDVARFGAQVINGIGFLGAGTVLVTQRQEVKGLTTAAGLWACACMGLAIGAGFYECVAVCFVTILVVVQGLQWLEGPMVEHSRSMNLYVEFDSMDHIGAIISRLKSLGVHIYEVDLVRERESRVQRPYAVFAIRLAQRQNHTQLMTQMSELQCIHTLEEL